MGEKCLQFLNQPCNKHIMYICISKAAKYAEIFDVRGASI